MSDFYKATVKKITGKTMYFSLTIIQPDIRVFPLNAESGFLILVQYFSEFANKNAPDEIKNNFNLMVDNDWAKSVKSKYIKSFAILSARRAPDKVYKLKDDEFTAWWECESNLPFAEYKLVVKDVSLLAEINVGVTWGVGVYEGFY